MSSRRLLSAPASFICAAVLGAGSPCPETSELPTPLDVVSLETPAAAPIRAWTDKANLSMVSTTGNSKGNSLGFSNEFLYKWTNTSLAVNFGGVRIETTNVTRSATGLSTLPGGYVLTETETKTLTSDAYFANGRYDYKLTEHFFCFGNASWETNKPAGLDSRDRAILGVGVLWLDTPVTKLRTDVGGGFTKERPVFEPEGFDENHGTWQVSARVEQKLWASTLLTSEAAHIGNTKDKDDHLTTWKTSLTAKLSDRLALKIGYDLAYKNKPNAVAVTVMSVNNPSVIVGLIPVPLKKTDTMFTTSLVINF